MILEVDNVELNFNKKKILWGIYIKAEKGKITSILGRNGCGKTSLLRIIFGSLTPKYGTIRIQKKNVSRPLFKNKLINYLPQHALLPHNITLKSAFKFFKVDIKRFITTFENFRSHQKTKISKLSTGEIRIVETYLILKSDNDILLLDEPFSFIAPIYIEKIKKLLVEVKREKIVIITDHYFNDVLSISDNTYLLKNGSSKLISNKSDLLKEGYIPTSQ